MPCLVGYETIDLTAILNTKSKGATVVCYRIAGLRRYQSLDHNYSIAVRHDTVTVTARLNR